jgi:hypothetical protein
MTAVSSQKPDAALSPCAGQLDVDQVLELVVRDVHTTAAGGAVVGELVARPQTQRTYLRACRRFATWLAASRTGRPDGRERGPLPRPSGIDGAGERHA